jgi:hypothetical protein
MKFKLRIVLSSLALVSALAFGACDHDPQADDVESRSSQVTSPCDAGVDAGPANGIGTSPSASGIGTSPSVPK